MLKGAASLVGQAQSPTLLCPYDVPQLAVGGSGDVLAGCTGGLLARMLPAMTQTNPAAQQNSNAAADQLLPPHMQPAHVLAGQAVALHALAGKSLAEQWPLRGNTPSDVADALPRTLATYAGALATYADAVAPYADAVAAAQPAPHSQSRDFKDDILPWPR